MKLEKKSVVKQLGQKEKERRLTRTNPVLTAAFIFDQETPKDDKTLKHMTSIVEIEARSGLDFFSELPDAVEHRIE